MDTICRHCKKPFIPHIYAKNKEGEITQRYCTDQCRSSFIGKRFRAKWSYNNTSATNGAIAELLVALDLMKKGFEVFKNLSPNGINDLVAYQNNKFYGIDVKTGRQLPGGDYTTKYSKIKANYLATFIQTTEEIIYYPPIKL